MCRAPVLSLTDWLAGVDVDDEAGSLVTTQQLVLGWNKQGKIYRQFRAHHLVMTTVCFRVFVDSHR